MSIGKRSEIVGSQNSEIEPGSYAVSAVERVQAEEFEPEE